MVMAQIEVAIKIIVNSYDYRNSETFNYQVVWATVS